MSKESIGEFIDLQQMIYQTIKSQSEIGLQNILEIDSSVGFNNPRIDELVLQIPIDNSVFLMNFVNSGYDIKRIIESPGLFENVKKILKSNSSSEILEFLIVKGFEMQKLKNEFSQYLLQLLELQQYSHYMKYLKLIKSRESYISIEKTVETIEKSFNGLDLDHFDEILDVTNLFTYSYKLKKQWIWKYIESHQNIGWERIQSLFIGNQNLWIEFLKDMLINIGLNSTLDVEGKLNHEIMMKKVVDNSFIDEIIDGEVNEDNYEFEEFSSEEDENSDE